MDPLTSAALKKKKNLVICLKFKIRRILLIVLSIVQSNKKIHLLFVCRIIIIIIYYNFCHIFKKIILTWCR